MYTVLGKNELTMLCVHMREITLVSSVVMKKETAEVTCLVVSGNPPFSAAWYPHLS